MTRTLYLGTDPGRHGAAALVTPQGALLAAWAWTPVVGGYRVRGFGNHGTYADPFDLGRHIGAMARFVALARSERHTVAGVEGLFVGRASGSSAPDTLALAEWVGEYRAGVRAAITDDPAFTFEEVPPADRPRAQTWRASQLGKGWGAADRTLAEEHAVKVAAALAPGFPPADWTKSERGAASEAFFIARHIAALASRPGAG